MRTILQEYGRTIIALCGGSVAILLCATFLMTHLSVCVSSEWKDELSVQGNAQCPLLLVPKVIKIDLGDEDYDEYCSLVEAYENSDKAVKCQHLRVEGTENVDVDCPGRYWVRFIAENTQGNVSEQTVSVIVR